MKMVDEAFTVASPLFAVALAGVESGEDKQRRQIGIVDDLLCPPDWSQAGLGYIVDLPDALVFLYQALHGAVCMQTNQVALAVELARSKFKRPRSLKSEVLMEEGAWVGWPGSISEDSTDAWKFLAGLPERHPWLVDLFGTKEEYVAALSAYYALLNILELVNIIAGGHIQILDGRELHLGVPLCGFAIPHETSIRAYRYLTSNAQEVRRAWEDLGVSTGTMSKYWPVWMQNCKRWLGGVYRHYFRGVELYVQDFFQLPGFITEQGKSGK